MGYGIERIDQQRGISWWHNIIQPVRSYGYILHVDGDNSITAVPHLDGHDVGVEEKGKILCSIQKVDPREVCVQAGEDVCAGFRDIAKGTSYLDICGGRHVDEVEETVFSGSTSGQSSDSGSGSLPRYSVATTHSSSENLSPNPKPALDPASPS